MAMCHVCRRGLLAGERYRTWRMRQRDQIVCAVCEPTDSIMSVGDVVRPQHYSTFHAALTDITDQEPWALGPPTGRNDPLPAGAAGGGVRGPGDFPVPQPGEPVAV